MGHRTRLGVFSSSSRFSPWAEHFVFSFSILVAFLLLSLIPDGNCSNDQDAAAILCRSLVFDSAEAITGTRLINHVISIISSIEEDLCITRCYIEPNCVSYNFKTAEDENGNHVCEINNSTHQGHENDLKEDSNYKFQRAKSACVSSPCKNHGTCQAGFTDRGYRCLCTAGFGGHDCEISEIQSAAVPTSERRVLSPSSLNVSPATSVSVNGSSSVVQSESTSVSTSVPITVSRSVPHSASLPGGLSPTFILRASSSKRLSARTGFLPMSQTSFHSTNMRMRTSDMASPLIRPSASQPLTRVSASLTATQSAYVPEIVSRSSSQSEPRPASVATNVPEHASSSVCRHSLPSTAASLDSSLAVLDDEYPGSNYTLSFPGEGTSNYVRIPCGMPSLNAVTICLWMKTIDATHAGQTTVLSYRRGRAATGNREIWLYFSNNKFWFRIPNGYSHRYLPLSHDLNDGQWHHICVTWDNGNGSWHMYKDGMVHDQDNGWKGYVIPGGGALVLGEKECSHKRCFVGQLTGVNIWDHVVNEQEIENMSSLCLSGVGNVFQWRDFKHYLKGSVAIIPSSC